MAFDPSVGAVQFGVNADDPFGIETAEKIQLQSVSETEGASAVIVSDKAGEYITTSQKVVDKKVSINASYQAVILGSLGSVSVSAYGSHGSGASAVATANAVDSVTITAQAGQHLTFSASGHRHENGSRAGHNSAGARTVTVSGISGFGTQYLTPYCGVPVEALQSASLQIQFGHTDEKDKDGNFLCGTTHGLTVTATYEAIDPETWTVPDGWVVTNKSTGVATQSNSSHQSRTLTIVRYFPSGNATIAATQSAPVAQSGSGT